MAAPKGRPGRRRLRCGALALFVDLVVDAVNQSRQMNVEGNLGKGTIEIVGVNARLIGALDDRQH